jgi:hypothetical protein
MGGARGPIALEVEMSDMAYSEGLEAESALSEVLVRRLLPGARLVRGRRKRAGLAVGLAASVPLPLSY